MAQGLTRQGIDLLLTDKYIEQLVQQKRWNKAIELARDSKTPERKAARTVVVIRSLLRMGERGLALTLLKEAVGVAANISHKKNRMQVYISILVVAAESESIDVVIELSNEVIASLKVFPDVREKSEVLYQISMSLAGVGLKDFGSAIVNDLVSTGVDDYTIRSDALRKLSRVMIKYQDLERLIALIHQHWLGVTIRDEALKLLPAVTGVISRDAETINNFTQSFAWVDEFLNVT